MIFINLLPYRLQVLIYRLLKWPVPVRPHKPASIVPTETIAGHALIMVITIMTFLAALSIGAVDVVHTTAQNWETQVAREVTVQVMPRGGRNIDDDVTQAQALIKKVKGIRETNALSDTEIGALLEPWLGKGFSLDNLPTPRLIVIQVDDDALVDWAKLQADLKQAVPTASLDDHRLWMDKLRAVGWNFVIAGLTVVVLVLVATALSVLFATRGAMAGNNDIVSVLHVVGAKDSYIARAFERRFLSFGLKGSLLGGGLAVAVFLLAGWLWNRNPAGLENANQALLGQVNIGGVGYGGILAIVIFVSFLTALTSRFVVMAHLRSMP